MKGLIALDIDGTLTPDLLRIPQEVVSYLEDLSKMGWAICLVTGRSFHFAEPAIKNLSFPYFLAVLNGALILKMPSRVILKRHYINFNDVPGIEDICKNEPTDFVIYSGYEAGDICYYRPHCYPIELCRYLEDRADAFREIWKPVEDFRSIGIEYFPSIKCVGPEDVILRIAARTVEAYPIAMPVIRDPRKEGYFVGLGTHAGINKGKAVIDLKELLRIGNMVIAAGDDFNDIPMLEVADISIVMESAPFEMHALADILAKPAKENGIIEALQAALEKEDF